jgi:hypothetical protein
MRMRKLGKGQSVVFCVPEEIETKILEHISKDAQDIDVIDVLLWVIRGTYADLRRNMPLWAAQGMRYEKQKLLWDAARRDDKFQFAESEVEKFLEDEAQSLETRYSPQPQTQHLQSSESTSPSCDHSVIIERCHEFGTMALGSKSLQEEQERELSPEIEQERQVEKPGPAKSRPHHLHADVLSFAKTGKLPPESDTFLNAFKALESSSAATFLDVNQFPPGILVTSDFAFAVHSSGKQYVSDLYQRSVQWILTSVSKGKMEHLIIISPFEADKLLPIIEAHKVVSLHLYAPRPTLELHSLDSLNLFTQGRAFDPTLVDKKLIVQLNLFAGQLYLSSFQEYKDVCGFLGLAWKETGDDVQVSADGFIKPIPGSDGFKISPVKFFQILLRKIRRNCESIEKTHLGRILNGEVLETFENEEF